LTRGGGKKERSRIDADIIQSVEIPVFIGCWAGFKTDTHFMIPSGVIFVDEKAGFKMHVGTFAGSDIAAPTHMPITSPAWTCWPRSLEWRRDAIGGVKIVGT